MIPATPHPVRRLWVARLRACRLSTRCSSEVRAAGPSTPGAASSGCAPWPTPSTAARRSTGTRSAAPGRRRAPAGPSISGCTWPADSAVRRSLRAWWPVPRPAGFSPWPRTSRPGCSATVPARRGRTSGTHDHGLSLPDVRLRLRSRSLGDRLRYCLYLTPPHGEGRGLRHAAAPSGCRVLRRPAAAHRGRARPPGADRRVARPGVRAPGRAGPGPASLVHQEQKSLALQGREADLVRHHGREHWNEVAAHLGRCRPVADDARVLEVGSGAHGLVFGCGLPRAVGLDPLAAEYARLFPAWQRRVPTVAGAGERLPFREHAFDVVLCDNVVDHAEKPREVVRELARVLRPDGLLYFTVNVHHDSVRRGRPAAPHPQHVGRADRRRSLLPTATPFHLLARRRRAAVRRAATERRLADGPYRRGQSPRSVPAQPPSRRSSGPGVLQERPPRAGRPPGGLSYPGRTGAPVTILRHVSGKSLAKPKFIVLSIGPGEAVLRAESTSCPP